MIRLTGISRKNRTAKLTTARKLSNKSRAELLSTTWVGLRCEHGKSAAQQGADREDRCAHDIRLNLVADRFLKEVEGHKILCRPSVAATALTPHNNHWTKVQ